MSLIRKSVSYGIVLCSLLGFFAFTNMGHAPTTNAPAAMQKNEYAAARSLAEFATREYLTIDADNAKRQEELTGLIPGYSSPPVPKGISQKVDQAKSIEPVEIGNSRIEVPVDTWLTLKKDSGETSHRHLLLTFKVFVDHGSQSIDGLPSIEPAPSAPMIAGDTTTSQPVTEDDKKAIRLMLQGFLSDYFSAKDPDELKNSVTANGQVVPLSGMFQFKSIDSISISLKQLQSFRADASVTIVDTSLNIPMHDRVVVSLQKDGDKYFVSGIGFSK